MERFPKIALPRLREGFRVLCANVNYITVRYLKGNEFNEQDCPTKQKSLGPRCKPAEQKGEKKSKKKDDKMGAKGQKNKDVQKAGQKKAEDHKDSCKKK